MTEPASARAPAEALEGLIAACERALAWLLDPELPGGVDPVLVAHVEQVREQAMTELAATAKDPT